MVVCPFLIVISKVAKIFIGAFLRRRAKAAFIGVHLDGFACIGVHWRSFGCICVHWRAAECIKKKNGIERRFRPSPHPNGRTHLKDGVFLQTTGPVPPVVN